MHSNQLKSGSYKKNVFDLSLVQFEIWCTRAIKHPRISIILPLLITFLFSYPLLWILQEPWEAFSSAKHHNYVSKMEIINLREPALFESHVDLNLLQVWVKPLMKTNILNKRMLLDSLAFQARLLKGVDDTAILSSPFHIWNHSLDALKKDPLPLRTISSNILKIPRYSLLGTWKINGVVSSASGFVISLLVNRENFANVSSLLNKNIIQLDEISNITGYHILQDANQIQRRDVDEVLKYTMISSNMWDNGVFIILCLLLMIYFIFSIQRTKNSVKSASGIAIAIVVQVVLVVISSSTITDFLFKASDENLPFHLLYLPLGVILVNNRLRVIRDVSGSTLHSYSLSERKGKSQKKISEAYDDLHERDFVCNIALSHYNSTKGVVLISLATIFAVPFSRKASCFLLISLWIGHFLQCEFFTAVLSLDFRRFESDNILVVSKSKSEAYLDQDVQPSPTSKNSLKKWCSYDQLCSVSCSIAFFLLYTVCFNRRFALTRTSTSIFYKIFTFKFSSIIPSSRPSPNAVFDHRLAADLMSDPAFVGSLEGKIDLLLSFIQPVFVLKVDKGGNEGNLSDIKVSQMFDNSSFTSAYKFEFTYALESILLVLLVISCTLLLLQKIMVKLDSINGLKTPELHQGIIPQDNEKRKEEKDHVTNQTEKLHNPENSVDQFHIKELYNQGHTLDIIDITDSKSPFVVSVGLDYKVFVWSPLVEPIPPPASIPLHRKFWPLSKVIISNDGYHIAFFSKHGNITAWSRRHMKFMWELQMKQNLSKNNAAPLEAFFRKITVPSFKRNRQQASGSKQPLKNDRVSLNTLDFITVTSVAGIDASYEQITNNPNDEDENEELVFVTAAGLIYSIDISGKIRLVNATSSDHPLISCKKLTSPRVNDRLVMCNKVGDLYVSTAVNNKWRPRKLSVNYSNVIAPKEKFCKIVSNDASLPSNDTSEMPLETDYTIELVPFVGMLVRVIGTNAELIDAQTGTLIRTISISHFKPNSLRVFHDAPTHCRFCGSASVASFSIAYTDSDHSRVVLHTFRLESRTKTSICLRVERDAREIRCLGMESAVETIHYFYNVENWCVTESNMLIGIRRVPENIVNKIGTTSISINASDEPVSLQNRKHKNSDGSSMVNSASFKIHNIWEGWTMSANGTVKLHKIPVGVNGLIVNKLGPLVSFGAKAMVVGFANIMSLFYLGHEDLLFTTENDGANSEESSLKFVNKRRDRFSHRKVPINYTNAC
ncbi:hypothetical protein HG535_0B04090 [Zygotorulaspora mrakii]|uniref:HMGCR/SNAP/NPC1-like sterol-sensing domain-containing protein n=1 Tax=Zygotorulaspora mrakii TaxID=42260 RepID=A0A7H9AYX4_ZYGMR|nr:uncharacterized protein HG535_0B04090 [Zygotorulaspora mrakii]QLG71367.1 hypothetical protein HG535_0B04090 [Zygotorulaspora mrakii]